MDVTEGLTGEGTRNGRARTLQSRAKEKRLMENRRARAGRKEVERFVGQLREFGGNGRFNRPVRRTGRLVLGAASRVVGLDGLQQPEDTPGEDVLEVDGSDRVRRDPAGP